MARLSRVETGGITYWTDPVLEAEHGVVIAFTERGGGVSESPYASLNLAAHVDDDPAHVDANRTRLLGALGLAHARDRLVVAEQVHGHDISLVDAAHAGAGAYAAHGAPPVTATDAMITSVAGLPILMCFADCVPIVLVAPGPTVAVVHAGWRGALAGLPGMTARALSESASCETHELTAYIGAHIGRCCYPVGEEILSHFAHAFVTVSRAESTDGLDLGAAVTESLSREGVKTCSIAHLGVCTAENTERFFSHRAEGGLTGRHGALACIL